MIAISFMLQTTRALRNVGGSGEVTEPKKFLQFVI